MGYYANGSGCIRLKKAIPEETLDKVLVEFMCESFFIDGVPYLNIWNDDKYYADSVKEALNVLIPYTEEGNVRYMGEDDCIWRFRFDPESKSWVEENGTFVFGYDDLKEAFGEEDTNFLKNLIRIAKDSGDLSGSEIEKADRILKEIGV